MDLGLGGAAGRAGSGGGGTRGMSGSGGAGGGGSGSGRNSTFALGGGGASAAAWTRLVSSGVEDELVFASGGGGCAGAGAGGLPQGHFLEACFLCRKPLFSNRDIFMYRGDIPFCTEECRREQMEMDEEMERKENSNPKKVAARAASHAGVESPPRPPKARAGSILAG